MPDEAHQRRLTDLADELLDAVGGFRREARRAAPSPVGSFTASQVELLGVVRRQPGMSISDAATTLRLAVNTVSTLVAQLVDARMLIRETDPADRRIARLRLTRAATRHIEAARDIRAAAVAAAVGRLGPAQRERMKDAAQVLHILTAAMADRSRHDS